MKRFLSLIALFALMLLWGKTVLCTTFDERLWEKYAEINTSSLKNDVGLAGVYLEPNQLGNIVTRTFFADLRVVNDRKEEVPWQIILKKPEKRTEYISARMLNLSRTEKNETWLELVIDKQNILVNAVEIDTDNIGFSRQVQIFGSPDGKTWNILRKDGVVFDINQGEKLRHTRISFPQTGFRHLALKISNSDAEPLKITDIKVMKESNLQGQIYTIHGTSEMSIIDNSRQENSIIVRMNTVFPLDRLIITTAERNFQRLVEIQIKRDNGKWERWAQGTIFNFDTPTIHESQSTIDIPEVATGEFRLIFKNLDSPPLSISGVNGIGYRRLLVFKLQKDQKMYLFFGNPIAQQPKYDLAGLIARQRPEELPIAYIGRIYPNSKFAGNNARLPFTERYKYLLYVIVIVGIACLICLQYRVFKRTFGEKENS